METFTYLVSVESEEEIPIDSIWDALDSYFHDSIVSEVPIYAHVGEIMLTNNGDELWDSAVRRENER